MTNDGGGFRQQWLGVSEGCASRTLSKACAGATSVYEALLRHHHPRAGRAEGPQRLWGRPRRWACRSTRASSSCPGAARRRTEGSAQPLRPQLPAPVAGPRGRVSRVVATGVCHGAFQARLALPRVTRGVAFLHILPAPSRLRHRVQSTGNLPCPIDLAGRFERRCRCACCPSGWPLRSTHNRLKTRLPRPPWRLSPVPPRRLQAHLSHRPAPRSPPPAAGGDRRPLPGLHPHPRCRAW